MTLLQIDDPATWPDAVKRLLGDNYPLLEAYELERRRIDHRAAMDVVFRANHPDNKFGSDRDQIIRQIEDAVMPLRVRAWHCSRLTDDEVARIRTDGLIPLSEQTLISRIERRVEAGDISEAIAGELRALHQAGDANRANAVHFLLTSDGLQDRMGVVRLFSSWGGEALYNSHEDHAARGRALRRVGLPRIVVAALPVSEVHSFQEVGKSIYRFHMNSKGISTRIGYGCEGTMRRTVRQTEIDAILGLNDAEFAVLTGCKSWQPPLA